MTKLIHLTVNGVRREIAADNERTLLLYLREDLGLTGAKNGCDGSGTCGACTVLVNGVAKKSCQLLLHDACGADVVTIEGLSPDGSHPIQRAFVAHGAVQCGFCTPGMILATKALLDQTANPTDADILRGLSGNLCRCTGYAKILQAVQSLASNRHDVTEPEATRSQIGASLPRPDAWAKTTGEAMYADDLHEPDDLVLRVVWSPEPRARLRHVDIEAALAMPGVVAVLTAKDIPGINAYGPIHRNQPVLCDQDIRFTGDPVALVVAETQDAADQAVEEVVLDLEALKPVFDPIDALAESAPSLHPGGNVLCDYRLAHGDVSKGFAEADTVVSGRFTTPATEHAYLEPEAGVAEWIDDTVIVRAAGQYPQTIQDQLAAVLGISSESVRVICPTVGGAFGGKTDISVHALLALAAWHTKRRVRLTWTREESLRCSVKRHPMAMDYRMAFDSKGQLLAIEGDLIANAGAYESLSHPLLEQTAAFSTDPYRVPAVDVRVRGVYTNTAISSAFRGFGIPQPTFAVESLLDEAARKLGLSPIELRRRNALRAGDRSATGQVQREDTHIIETLDAIEEQFRAISDNLKPNEGVGIACGYKNVGLGLGESDHATATLHALPDGRLLVDVGAVDVGQGSETVLGQIAAEKLGVDPHKVSLRWGDTTLTPDGRETNASRQTVVSGNAVLACASKLADALCRKASECFPGLAFPVHYDQGVVGADGTRIAWADCCSRLNAPVVETVRYTAPDTSPLETWDDQAAAPTNYFAYTFFTNLAHVSVDPATGKATVLRLISAYDIGRVINQQAAEGQIEGGALMGMGFALTESYVAHGANQTRTLAQCGIPRFMVLPTLETCFVESADSIGPHGAKGIGEVAMISVAPSITNAICDATQIRVRDLPASPRSVRDLLEQRSKEAAS